ncbi:mannitol dehydrogenase family protein [Cohnella abietis]|uniref:Mannitol-1-phosphate 5-dehydrogenase n=1 Tax=Cohnella abietis TaxID=2507935 RepID=A0A3T1D659_9BACL|nr:mannitol-1-phosphate 5-dehydrogenase [Cohnella abietis]BBI33570.1 mannitol-1-phosphate 5-dehydrogenase [Cohnella abietis]
MKAIIFGGGKIARGFIAHLLYLSKAEIVFVDVNEQLVSMLNNRDHYRVHIMGADHKSADIKGFSGLSLSDAEGIAKVWEEADVAFTSVGGKNLSALAKSMAAAFALRCQKPFTKPFQIITCENWKRPAAELKLEVRKHLTDDQIQLFDQWVGIAEAAVMRSAVEPPQALIDADPLCVCVQDHWELPVDLDAVVGEPPEIEHVRYISQFGGFLERKIFTNNTGNATISYLGNLKKHLLVSDAANDADIEQLLDVVYGETGKALSAEYGIPLPEQIEFAHKAKKKYQDANIVDYVERHARDPIRKLGPEDRLVGAARLAERHGIEPMGIATAIAAALYYDQPSDPFAVVLKERRESEGVVNVMTDICGIAEDEPLGKLVQSRIVWLQMKGWISI